MKRLLMGALAGLFLSAAALAEEEKKVCMPFMDAAKFVQSIQGTLVMMGVKDLEDGKKEHTDVIISPLGMLLIFERVTDKDGNNPDKVCVIKHSSNFQLNKRFLIDLGEVLKKSMGPKI